MKRLLFRGPRAGDDARRRAGSAAEDDHARRRLRRRRRRRHGGAHHREEGGREPQAERSSSTTAPVPAATSRTSTSPSAPADGSVILLGSVGPLAVAPHMMKVGYDPQKDLAPLTMGVDLPQRAGRPRRARRQDARRVRRARQGEAGRPRVRVDRLGLGVASRRRALQRARRRRDRPHSRTRAARRRCRTSSAAGSRPTSRCPRPPSRTSRPASSCLWRRPDSTRPSFMANVPTVAESGFPGFNATNWYAFVAPGKTPAPILDRWNRELVKAMNDPEVKEELIKRGLIPSPTTREELGALHRRRIGRSGRRWSASARSPPTEAVASIRPSRRTRGRSSATSRTPAA